LRALFQRIVTFAGFNLAEGFQIGVTLGGGKAL